MMCKCTNKPQERNYLEKVSEILNIEKKFFLIIFYCDINVPYVLSCYHTSNEHLYNIIEYEKNLTLMNSWMWMYYVEPTKSILIKMLKIVYKSLESFTFAMFCNLIEILRNWPWNFHQTRKCCQHLSRQFTWIHYIKYLFLAFVLRRNWQNLWWLK